MDVGYVSPLGPQRRVGTPEEAARNDLTPEEALEEVAVSVRRISDKTAAIAKAKEQSARIEQELDAQKSLPAAPEMRRAAKEEQALVRDLQPKAPKKSETMTHEYVHEVFETGEKIIRGVDQGVEIREAMKAAAEHSGPVAEVAERVPVAAELTLGGAANIMSIVRLGMVVTEMGEVKKEIEASKDDDRELKRLQKRLDNLTDEAKKLGTNIGTGTLEGALKLGKTVVTAIPQIAHHGAQVAGPALGASAGGVAVGVSGIALARNHAEYKEIESERDKLIVQLKAETNPAVRLVIQTKLDNINQRRRDNDVGAFRNGVALIGGSAGLTGGTIALLAATGVVGTAAGVAVPPLGITALAVAGATIGGAVTYAVYNYRDKIQNKLDRDEYDILLEVVDTRLAWNEATLTKASEMIAKTREELETHERALNEDLELHVMETALLVESAVGAKVEPMNLEQKRLEGICRYHMQEKHRLSMDLGKLKAQAAQVTEFMVKLQGERKDLAQRLQDLNDHKQYAEVARHIYGKNTYAVKKLMDDLIKLCENDENANAVLSFLYNNSAIPGVDLTQDPIKDNCLRYFMESA